VRNNCIQAVLKENVEEKLIAQEVLPMLGRKL